MSIKKSKKARRQHIHLSLRNDCYRTEMKVIPSNWEADNAKVLESNGENFKWQISYRFYDPSHPKRCKQVAIRLMNKAITVATRQAETRTLIRQEVELIDKQHYNPLWERYMTEDTPDGTDPNEKLSDRTPLVIALKKGVEEKPISGKWKKEVQNGLDYFYKAAILVNKHNTPIGEIGSRDIINILQRVKDVPVIKNAGTKSEKTCVKIWHSAQFNRYCDYLRCGYDYLTQHKIIQDNVMKLVDPALQIEEPPQPLPEDAELARIDTHLREVHPRFHRFMNIFYESGMREEEILRIRGKHVDLNKQIVWIYVYKGIGKKRLLKPTRKTITNNALPLWRAVMNDGIDEYGKKRPCKPEECVFAPGFRPGREGKKPMRTDQIQRYWRRWVKNQLGTTFTFYRLKSLFTTRLRNLQEIENTQGHNILDLAVIHNSHTSAKMNNEVYDVEYDNRIHKKMMAVHNPLVKKKKSA